ncbi:MULTISPECIES: hypothetical protein [Aeromonas]|uniref:Uncharacterized protein n=1 Tax=Aeromonas caviae TaxID=648 RepID=A0AA42VEH7_AERCA|nr:hypothetical protein [Aeromonas caviae]MDH1899217.1 hypothetical protein [Aeromonas caviae]
MNKTLKIIILSSSLLLTATSVNAAYLASSVKSAKITATYTDWGDMKADGWRSADNFDDEKMSRALRWEGEIINQYPWTKYAFLRKVSGSPYFLADKKEKTLTYLSFKARSGDYSDIVVTYQGVDEGKGCYVSIVDSGRILEIERTNPWPVPDVLPPPIEAVVLKTLPENCVNNSQLNAIKAKQAAEDKKLKQWVGEQTLKELCRRNGNC